MPTGTGVPETLGFFHGVTGFCKPPPLITNVVNFTGAYSRKPKNSSN
jgi:hypothetical protein